MRKYILSALTFFGLFVLSGCGGGSDNISNSGTSPDTIGNPAVEIKLTEMIITGDKFVLPVSFIKKIDSSYKVELSNFNLSVDGCTLSQTVFTPDVLHLDGGVGSSDTVNIRGVFDPNCTATKYIFSATQKTTKDGKVDTRMFSVTYDSNNPDGGGDITLVPSSGFFNATTPLEITQADTAYEIKVQMIEDGYVASGKSVQMKPFDSQYGGVASYESTTGADGYAIFPYVSPSILPIDGTFINLELTHDDNGTMITQNIVLKFNSTGVPPSAPEVTDMYISPDSFIITSPDEVKSITIVTVNANNIGISAEVLLEEPNNGTDYGSFDTTNVTTDASGKAVVVYTAPKDISILNERNITISTVGTSITKELNIAFYTSSKNTIYEIVATVPNSLSIESQDNIGIKIVEVGNPANVIADTNVNEVNLTSQFSNMLVFTNGTDTTIYSGIGENTQIGIKTKTLSGAAIIEVSASIYDGVNDVTITKSIPLTIISGPVTSMSMVYVGSGTCETTPSLPASKYLIHAVDKYSNPAQAVRVTPTLINGIKEDFKPDRFNGTGSISGTSNPTFNDGSVDFVSSDVTVSDRLIVTINSNQDDPSYLGNWSLDDVLQHELDLKESYTGVTTSGLSYAIGSEDRILGTDRVVAHIVDPKGNYLTDAGGTLEVEVCFDPLLAGHTMVLAAHVIDRGARTGISTIQPMRWDQYTSGIVEFDNDGLLHTALLTLGIGGSISGHLIDVTIASSAFNIKTDPHCIMDIASSDFHTNGSGQVQIVINTDGNTSATGGVDKCTVEWDTNPTSVLYEY